MGPAIWVPGSGGLIAPEALTAAAGVEPYSVPGAVVALIQNDRITFGSGEGALTAASGEPGESGTPVCGCRCAGDVDGADVTASRVVVGDDDLIRIIRVNRTECLRLGNVGISLGASDQVNVRGAIHERRQQFLDKLGEGSSRRSGTSFCLAAENHDRSGPEVLLLIDAQIVNAGTIESGRDQGIDGVGCSVILLRLRGARSGERAKAQQREKNTGQENKETD